MIHVGISGPIAAGKSTLAKELQILARNEGYGAEIVSFATGVRELVALEYVPYRRGIIQQKLYGWGLSLELAQQGAYAVDMAMTEYPSNPDVKNRRLLQIIGTEIGRQLLGKDIWITRTQQLIRGYEAIDFAFSDDLRFDNEAVAVDVHVAITIDGQREAQIYLDRVSKLSNGYVRNDHPSEQSLTLPALFTIPIAFDKDCVAVLFNKLDYARRLRYG